MSNISALIERLIAKGLTAGEAGEIVAEAFGAGVASVPDRRSSGAKRAARYRTKTDLQSVTKVTFVTPDPKRDERDESVTNVTHVTQPSLLLEEKKEREPKRNASHKRSSLPDNFILTEPMRLYWTAKGLDPGKVDFQFEKFCNHHRSKGSLFVDWQAAWRTWTGNALSFAEDAKRQSSGFRYNGIEGVL